MRYTVLGARPGTSEPISSTDNGTVHRCAGARVTSVADFHEQLGAGRFGVAQPTMEGAADLHSLARDRITPTETISSQTRGAFPRARPKRSADAIAARYPTSRRVLNECWMIGCKIHMCAGESQRLCWSKWWGGWGSNPRPRDYESEFGGPVGAAQRP